MPGPSNRQLKKAAYKAKRKEKIASYWAMNDGGQVVGSRRKKFLAAKKRRARNRYNRANKHFHKIFWLLWKEDPEKKKEIEAILEKAGRDLQKCEKFLRRFEKAADLAMH